MAPILKIVQTDEPRGLRLSGELDMSSAPELEEALAEFAIRGETVTLDLSELTFCDSYGLHVVVRHALSMNGNGPLVLVNPSPIVRQALEIIGVGGIPRVELRSG